MTHLARVAALPCCVCGSQPVQVHHIRHVGITGVGQKCSDWFVVPLCPPCHSDFHREGRALWEMRNGQQLDHVAQTLEMLYG